MKGHIDRRGVTCKKRCDIEIAERRGFHGSRHTCHRSHLYFSLGASGRRVVTTGGSRTTGHGSRLYSIRRGVTGVTRVTGAERRGFQTSHLSQTSHVYLARTGAEHSLNWRPCTRPRSVSEASYHNAIQCIYMLRARVAGAPRFPGAAVRAGVAPGCFISTGRASFNRGPSSTYEETAEQVATQGASR
jgi:hypothetical protein